MLDSITPGLILNVAFLLGLLVFGPRALKVAALKAQIDAKDSIIKTREQTNEALVGRLEVLEDEIQSLHAKIDEDRTKITGLERDVTEWRTRYQEMEKYAAPEALASITHMIADAVDGGAKWDARWDSVEGLMREVRTKLDQRRSEDASTA